jgi:hypothetical protein
MENSEQQTKQSQRDYDKEPIVIKDYNYLFLLGFPLLLLIFIMVLDIFEIARLSIVSYVLISAVLVSAFYVFLKAHGKRYIQITNDSINFLHCNKIIESIKFDNIELIAKTISIQYHKSQNPTKLQKEFCRLAFPIALVVYFFIMIFKFLFHFYMDGLKGYRFFDSIIIYGKDNSFINVHPTFKTQRDELKEYFINKLNMDIDKLETDKECLFLGIENIKVEGE